MSIEDRAQLSADMDQVKRDLQRILKSLEGNGRPGLIERVEGLEKWRAGIVACIALLTFAAGLFASLKH